MVKSDRMQSVKDVLKIVTLYLILISRDDSWEYQKALLKQDAQLGIESVGQIGKDSNNNNRSK